MVNSEISFRFASVGDAQELVRVHYKAVHEISQEFYPSEILGAWSPIPSQERIDWLSGIISSPNSISHVAVTADGSIAGFVILFLAESAIQALYVDPDYSGSGIGTSLLSLAEKEAKRLGLARLALKASLNAAGFYEGRGFVIICMGEHQLRDGTTMPAMNMEKLLSVHA